MLNLPVGAICLQVVTLSYMHAYSGRVAPVQRLSGFVTNALLAVAAGWGQSPGC